MKSSATTMYVKTSLFIPQQAVSMKFGPNRTTSTVSILHLPRFYVLYETMLVKSARAAIKKLTETPGRFLEASVLKQEFGKHTLKAFLTKEYSEIFGQRVCMYLMCVHIQAHVPMSYANCRTKFNFS
jgi:hypothetical protein